MYVSVRKIVKRRVVSDNLELLELDNGRHTLSSIGYIKDDLCVYFDAGCIIPMFPQLKFLDKFKQTFQEDCLDFHGYRIKKIKLKNNISDGVAVPIRIFSRIFKKYCMIGTITFNHKIVTKAKDLKLELNCPLDNIIDAKEYAITKFNRPLKYGDEESPYNIWLNAYNNYARMENKCS